MKNKIIKVLKSKQQIEIINLLDRISTVKKLSEALGIGEKCVSLHLSNIYKIIEETHIHIFKNNKKLAELIGLIDGIVEPNFEETKTVKMPVITDNATVTKTKLSIDAMIAKIEMDIIERKTDLEVLKKLRAKYA